MLSTDSINFLVQPIIDRQESINTFVLETIANRVGEIGKISPADLRRLKLLTIFGADIREMNSTLAEMSKLQVRDIKRMIKTAAIESHTDAKPLYDYRHKRFIPYDKNIKLQRIVTAIGNQTAQTYTNLSNSKATGFLIRDLQHPGKLKFHSINDTYQTIMDEAIQSVKSGVDYRVAMRRALKQLADSGIRRLYWDSGYTQRVDTAVRRNLLDAVRQIDQGVEDLVGKEGNSHILKKALANMADVSTALGGMTEDNVQSTLKSIMDGTYSDNKLSNSAKVLIKSHMDALSELSGASIDEILSDESFKHDLYLSIENLDRFTAYNGGVSAMKNAGKVVSKLIV